MQKRIRIIVADEHLLVRQVLAGAMRAQADIDVVAEVSEAKDMVRCFSQHRPDLALVEIALPNVSDGINVIRTTLTHHPEAHIVVLSRHEGPGAILSALEVGAKAYLFKSMETNEVLEEIRSAHRGILRIHPKVLAVATTTSPETRLTYRECEVLMMIEEGLSNKEIASRLNPHVTEATVKIHVEHIFTKLQVGDRMAAVRRGINGWFITPCLFTDQSERDMRFERHKGSVTHS